MHTRTHACIRAHTSWATLFPQIFSWRIPAVPAVPAVPVVPVVQLPCIVGRHQPCIVGGPAAPVGECSRYWCGTGGMGSSCGDIINLMGMAGTRAIAYGLVYTPGEIGLPTNVVLSVSIVNQIGSKVVGLPTRLEYRFGCQPKKLADQRAWLDYPRTWLERGWITNELGLLDYQTTVLDSYDYFGLDQLSARLWLDYTNERGSIPNARGLIATFVGSQQKWIDSYPRTWLDTQRTWLHYGLTTKQRDLITNLNLITNEQGWCNLA